MHAVGESLPIIPCWKSDCLFGTISNFWRKMFHLVCNTSNLKWSWKNNRVFQGAELRNDQTRKGDNSKIGKLGLLSACHKLYNIQYNICNWLFYSFTNKKIKSSSPTMMISKVLNKNWSIGVIQTKGEIIQLVKCLNNEGTKVLRICF